MSTGVTKTEAKRVTTTKKAVAKKRVTSTRAKGTTTKTSTSKAKHLTVRGARGGAKSERVSITNNSTARQSVSPSVLATPTLTSPGTVASRLPLSLAVLSPFRFPVVSAEALGSFARGAGTFFVVVGALFSLLNLPLASGIVSTLSSGIHTAATGDSLTADGVNLLNTTISGTAGSLDTTPDAHIVVGSETATLTGMIPIVVTVPNATGVKLMLKSRSTGQTMVIGAATAVDATTWQIPFISTQYPDGEYRISAAVTNQHGSYDNTDSTTYTISNEASATNAVPAPIDSTVSTTTSTTATPEAPAVSLEPFDSDVVHGTVTLTVHAQGASVVNIEARNRKTGVPYIITSVKDSLSSPWTLVWDTTNVPDGIYTLTPYATIGGVSQRGDGERMEVENSLMTTTEDVLQTPTTTVSTNNIPVATDSTISVEPSVELKVEESANFAHLREINITTSPVTWVEIYARPEHSLTSLFVGLANKKDVTDWSYLWDTRNIPNGTYLVHVRVRSQYGFFDGPLVRTEISNTPSEPLTEKQVATVRTLEEAEQSLDTNTDETDTPDETSASSSLEAEPETPTVLKPIVTDFNKELAVLIGELGSAARTDDTARIREVTLRIDELKSRTLNTLPSHTDSEELVSTLNAEFSETIFELSERTLHNEKALRERIGDAVLLDEDGDSISDYDEVNLYRTNPFAADSDSDGFIDGAEIMSGFDPLDSTPQVPIAYESPIETGLTRDDILSVASITTVIDENAENSTPRALISGTGLPHSFVTLFIYSMPTVVTVRTDEAGNWTYLFDKELENGDHEVYAALTDNAGKLVAKSSPLPFVKTAEAYTGTTVAPAEVTAEEISPDFFEARTLFLVASIAVTALGLVLILLGVHAGQRREEPVLQST